MTYQGAVKAMEVATRFLEYAKEAIREIPKELQTPNGYTNLGPSKKSGAMRRASMDLTRALSDMRKLSS
jgi:hypothetical protein